MKCFITVLAIMLVMLYPAQSHASIITGRDLNHYMTGTELNGYLSGSVEMLRYMLFEQGEEAKEECIYNWFSRDGSGLKDIADAASKFPEQLAASINWTLIEQRCGSNLPGMNSGSLPDRVHPLTGKEFGKRMDEDGQDLYLLGAMEMMIYWQGQKEQDEKAACVFNWYFKKGGRAEWIIYINAGRFPDKQVVHLVSILVDHYC